MKKILFMLILLIPFITYAECDSKVLITKLELNEKKGYAEELEPSSYECNNIKLNIKMYNKDDSVIYNLTIKNNSDDDVELSNTFDSKSEYVTYKIEDENLIVEKGKEKTFKLSATYTKQVDPVLLVNGTMEDNQVVNLSVTTKDETKNPNTNNIGIALMVTVFVVSIFTIVLLILNRREASKYMLFLIPVLLIPVTVYALTKFELKLEAKVVIAEPKEKAIEPSESNSSTDPEEPVVEPVYVCKKATTLHSTICATSNNNFGCGKHVGKGNPITYGTLVNGNPKAGDAYDCDVNNDGIYDPDTERFYYLTTNDNIASLIYHKNYYDEEVEYHDIGRNFLGPVSNYQHLPSTTEWSNPLLIVPGTRQIVTEKGTTIANENGTGNTVLSSSHTIEPFTYTDRAARFLTYQEAMAACSYLFEENNPCTYLTEKLVGFEGGGFASGYWLETPLSSSATKVYIIYAPTGILREMEAADSYSVRPVIAVKTSDLEK